ncbi:DUF202 domain-containing protein [Mycobacterium sp. NPDC003449]
MPNQRPHRPGLQAERTQLSWERTALGFVAIGGILLFRQHGPLAPERMGITVLALLISVAVVAAGQVRARRIPAAPGPAVVFVGSATVVLAALLAGFIVVTA